MFSMVIYLCFFVVLFEAIRRTNGPVADVFLMVLKLLVFLCFGVFQDNIEKDERGFPLKYPSWKLQRWSLAPVVPEQIGFPGDYFSFFGFDIYLS